MIDAHEARYLDESHLDYALTDEQIIATLKTRTALLDNDERIERTGEMKVLYVKTSRHEATYHLEGDRLIDEFLPRRAPTHTYYFDCAIRTTLPPGRVTLQDGECR